MFIIKRSLRRNKQLSHGSLLRFQLVKKLITPLTGGLQKFHSPCVVYESIRPNYILTRVSCNHSVDYLVLFFVIYSLNAFEFMFSWK